MSHLSILPTVYTRPDLLEASLRHEGFDVVIGAVMAPFNGKSQPVDLLASLADDSPSLGWIQGDDGVVTSNLHPYAGLAVSLGVEGRVGSGLYWSAELYGAPGGHSTPDPEVDTLKGVETSLSNRSQAKSPHSKNRERSSSPVVRAVCGRGRRRNCFVSQA